MRQVIESDAESGDGVPIEREQPSTAFKSMGVFAKLDSITGRTIPQGDLTLEVLDSASLVQHDGQTFYKGPDGQLLGPLGGEGVFKHQDIDAKGSVIVGDNNFMPGRGGDSITGEGRPMKIWTNGGASTFENSDWIWQDCNDHKSDQDNNDVVIGVRENVSGTFAFETGLPVEGLHDSVHCITDGCGQNAPISPGQRVEEPSMHQGAMNSFWATDAAGNFLDAAGNMTETFKPAAGMDRFGESLNPVLELSGTAGPGGTTFMTGSVGFPTDNFVGNPYPSPIG